MPKFIFLVCFCTTVLSSFCQNNRLDINAVSEKGESIPGATVLLYGGKVTLSQNTDDDGTATFEALPFGKYRISVTSIGLEPVVLSITLDEPYGRVEVKMKASQQYLDEVIIKSELEKKKESPIKAEVIGIADKDVRAANISDIMNSTVGVRIRQNGGVGGASNIQINGFQGNSIRMFKDGIPMDYLGNVMGATSLNTVSSRMLNHIEVYKGILPGNLAADALGAGINIVTKKHTKSTFGISYEAGSFGTHRLSANWLYKKKGRKWYIGGEGYANYAKNNYTIVAELVDEQTANIYNGNIKLFHNRYKDYYYEGYAGFRDLKWADDIRFSLTAFNVNREIQSDRLRSKPYGEMFEKSRSRFIPSLRYKYTTMNNRFVIDQFLVYSRYYNGLVDTARNKYNWLGEATGYTDNRLGERVTDLNGELSENKNKNFISRTALSYELRENQSLDFNNVFNYYQLSGTDPHGTKIPGNTDLPLIALVKTYLKTATNIGWNIRFAKRLENIAQLKFYTIQAQGSDIDPDDGTLKEADIKNNKSIWGFSEALKLSFRKNSYVRGSVEQAVRMPEPVELFGDGTSRSLPNAALKPEESLNFNLGVHLQNKKSAYIEANVFYRRSKNMIYTFSEQNDYTISRNTPLVGGAGFELELNAPIQKWLRVNANATYQDLRMKELPEGQATQTHLLNARFSNMPYAYANAGLVSAFKDLIKKGDRFQAYWNFNYVHMYYRRAVPKEAEPDGFLGLFGKPAVTILSSIPSYGLHHIGIVYEFSTARPLSLGIEGRNIFNKEYYDNFRIQNPGRAIYAKLTFNIN